MTDSDEPVVVIAEDEDDVAEGYELWLGSQYDVRRAADGRAALELIDDAVDVVLLDRMMPELSGEAVLREIRERGIDCRVAMVTAVEPDFDVIEMGFDAYVTKPPDRGELIDTIETLLDRATVDERFQRYHSLVARKGAIETQKTKEELAASDKYQDLLDRIEQAETEVDDQLGDMGSEMEFVSAINDIDEGGDGFDGEIDGFEEDGEGFDDEIDGFEEDADG